MLASAALATALTPLAANATIMTPLDHVQIEAHKAIHGPLPDVQHVATHSDAAKGQTIVQSGPADQMYPDSLGG
jgi:hypothetical protein